MYSIRNRKSRHVLSEHINNRFSNKILTIARASPIGTIWDDDQEMNAHPSAIISMQDDELGYFEKLGARTETVLEGFFTVWGTYCARRPALVLFLGMFNNKKKQQKKTSKSLSIVTLSNIIIPYSHFRLLLRGRLGPWHQVHQHHHEPRRIVGVASLKVTR